MSAKLIAISRFSDWNNPHIVAQPIRYNGKEPHFSQMHFWQLRDFSREKCGTFLKNYTMYDLQNA